MSQTEEIKRRFTGVDLNRAKDMVQAIELAHTWVQHYNSQLPKSGKGADLFCNFNDALYAIMHTIIKYNEDFDSITDTSPRDAIYNCICDLVTKASHDTLESVAEIIVDEHADAFTPEELKDYDCQCKEISSVIEDLVKETRSVITYTNLHGHMDHIWSVYTRR